MDQPHGGREKGNRNGPENGTAGAAGEEGTNRTVGGTGAAVSQHRMSRRKLIAGFGLAGVAVASADLLGKSVIASITVQESVYGTEGMERCTNSVAELRNMRGFACKTVHMLGYYSANDGGGGLFYWDGASTAPDNGGTVIQPNDTLTGRWLRII